ncbi:MAG: hypothetical protein GY943_34015 [Chloroflexi bacterium]|nr:hypothetical protein [Chloroflexota bacterium]
MIPAGHDWICFQIESGDSQDLAGLGNAGLPASGMWDLFAIKIPLQPPTAVSLTSLSVRPIGGNDVVIQWQTVSEQDHFGFNLYRGETAVFDDAQKIYFAPATIPGGNPLGATYAYTDVVPAIGQWHYWLESADMGGTAVAYPVQMVNVTGKYQVYLPMLSNQ